MPISGGPLVARQIRRLKVPLQKLVDYLDRQTGLLTNTRLHTAQADARQKVLIIYVESDSDHPVSLDLDLDWEEIFGTIPCLSCGKMTHVEHITVCSNCARPKLPVDHSDSHAFSDPPAPSDPPTN